MTIKISNQFALSVLSILILSCGSLKPKESTLFDERGRVSLRLIPEVHKSEVTEYSSRGITRVYKGESLERKEKEEVDFSVEQKVLSVDSVKKQIRYSTKTIVKKGDGDLHEYAVPELNEEIEMILDDQANVLYAGKYAKNSVFFVPPMSLPKDYVGVGESWVMKKNWVTLTNQVPLSIEVVSILKEIQNCNGGKCAWIELSGEVSIVGADNKSLKLDSVVRGYLLFSIDLGTIVWSHVLNDQTLATSEFRAQSQSCLVSYISQPEWKKLKSQVNPYCKAEGKISEIKVPQI